MAMVYVRAFNKDGYHRDILIASDRQVHMQDLRVKEPNGSLGSGLIGWGGSIDPTDFSEMVKFEIVVRESSIQHRSCERIPNP